MSNKERKIRRERERERERERKALILCAFFSFWSISYCEIDQRLTLWHYCSCIFVAAFDLRVCLQLLSSQALTRWAPLSIKGKAWVSPWEVVLKGFSNVLGCCFVCSMVVKICFQQSAQVGMGHRFSDCPARHWAVSPWVQRFIFWRNFLPLGNRKNREGPRPLYKGFLGREKKPKISPHF